MLLKYSKVKESHLFTIPLLTLSENGEVSFLPTSGSHFPFHLFHEYLPQGLCPFQVVRPMSRETRVTRVTRVTANILSPYRQTCARSDHCRAMRCREILMVS